MSDQLPPGFRPTQTAPPGFTPLTATPRFDMTQDLIARPAVPLFMPGEDIIERSENGGSTGSPGMDYLLDSAVDPSAERAKLATAQLMGLYTGVPAGDFYANFDQRVQEVTGQPTTPQKFRDMWKNALQTGRLNRDIGWLGYAIWQDIVTGSGVDESKLAQVQKLQDEVRGMPRPELSFFSPRNVVRFGLEQAPMLLSAFEFGLPYAIGTSTAAGTIALIGGQMGPQVALPEELLTVPGAVVGGFSAAMAPSMATAYAQMTSGHVLTELLSEKITVEMPDGTTVTETIDPVIAATAAGLAGVLSGVLEMAQVKKVPGLGKIVGEVTEESLKRVLREGTLKQLAATYGRRWIVNASTQVLEEMVQEGSEVLAQSLATDISNAVHGTSLESQWNEILPTMIQTVKEGGLFFLATQVGPGTIEAAIERRVAQGDVEFENLVSEEVAAIREDQEAATEANTEAAEAGEAVYRSPETEETLTLAEAEDGTFTVTREDADGEIAARGFLTRENAIDSISGRPTQEGPAIGRPSYRSQLEVLTEAEEVEVREVVESMTLGQAIAQAAIAGQAEVEETMRQTGLTEVVEVEPASGDVAFEVAGEEFPSATTPLLRDRARRRVRRSFTKMRDQMQKVAKAAEKFSPRAAEAVNELLADVDLVRRNQPTQAKLDKVKAFLEEVSPEQEMRLPSDVRARLEAQAARADQKPLNDFTLQEFEDLHAAVMSIASQERKKNAIKTARAEKSLRKAVTNAVKGFAKGPTLRKKALRAGNEGGNVREFLRQGLLMRQMGHDAVGSVLFDTRSDGYRVLVRDLLTVARPKELKTRQGLERLIKQAAEGAGLEQIDYAGWLPETVTTIDAVYRSRGRAQMEPIEVTRGMRVAAYLHSLDQDNWDSFVLDGFGLRGTKTPDRVYRFQDEQQVRDIIDSMTEQERRFADEVVRPLMKETGRLSDDEWLASEGYALEIRENYFHKDVMPIAYRSNFAKEQDAFRKVGDWSLTMDRGRLMKRTGGRNTPIYWNAVEYEMNSVIDFTSSYVGFNRPLQQAAAMFNDAVFVQEFTDAYGAETYGLMRKAIQDIVDERMRTTFLDRAALFLRKMNARRALGINPYVTLKQAGSLMYFAPYTTAKDFAEASRDWVARRSEVQEALDKYAPLWTERDRTGMSRDLVETIHGGKRLAFAPGSGSRSVRGLMRKAEQKADVALFAGIHFVDKNVTGVGVLASQKRAFREMQEGKLSRRVATELDLRDSDLKNMSLEDKITQSFRYGEIAMTRGQPMFNPEYRSDIGRSNAFGRSIAQFSSFTARLLDLHVMAYHELRRFGDAEAHSGMAQLLVADLVGYVLFNAGVEGLRTLVRQIVTGEEPPDQPPLWVRLLTPLAGVFLGVRDIFQIVSSSVRYKNYGTFPFETAATRVVNLATAMLAEMARASDDSRSVRQRDTSIKRASRHAIDLIGQTLGIPYMITNPIEDFVQ